MCNPVRVLSLILSVNLAASAQTVESNVARALPAQVPAHASTRTRTSPEDGCGSGQSVSFSGVFVSNIVAQGV